MTTDFDFDGIPTTIDRPTTIGGWIFSLLLGAVFCIGLPVAVTAMAPVTYLKMTRNGEQVSAHSKTCLLLLIPFHNQSLENVTAITSQFHAGELMEVNGKQVGTSDRMIRSEDEGWLILANQERQMKVPISPANLEATCRDAKDFLEITTDAADNREFKKFCVTNWKVSIFAGVPLTLLTALYLVCILSNVVTVPFWLIRKFGSQSR